MKRAELLNRMEELRARLGRPEDGEEAGVASDPSWGPVGSVLERELDKPTLEHLLTLHRDMLALERSRRAAEAQEPHVADTPPAEPPAAPRPPVPRPVAVSGALPATRVHDL